MKIEKLEIELTTASACNAECKFYLRTNRRMSIN